MSNLVYLLEIEPGNRLDDDVWTNDSCFINCWWLTHSEGKPSKVEENGVVLAEQTSIEDCNNNAGSWYWGPDFGETREPIGDFEFGITEFYAYAGETVREYWIPFWPADNSLYIHTTGSDDPAGATYIILAFFWEYLCNKQFEGTNQLVFNDKWYDPRLDESGISDVGMSVTDFHQGGVVRSFSSVKILNADSRYDQRLYDYIYEAKKIIMKVGEKGDAYGDYSTALRGWTRSVSWNDKAIEIQIDDMRERFN